MSVVFDAALYASLHRGSPGDIGFYAQACAGAVRVLELGCGDGRVLEGVAPGPELVGLDAHEGMLQRARRRLGPAATLVHGDMADFALEGLFDRIIIPFTGFYCLPDDDAMVDCLRCVRRHLAPEGRVVLDAYPGEPLLRAGAFEPTWEFVTVLDHDGRTYTVYERDANDPGRAVIDVTYRHVDSAGSTMAYTLRHHYLCAADVPRLLACAGLRLLRLEGDFDGAPYDPEGDRMVVVAAV